MFSFRDNWIDNIAVILVIVIQIVFDSVYSFFAHTASLIIYYCSTHYFLGIFGYNSGIIINLLCGLVIWILLDILPHFVDRKL